MQQQQPSMVINVSVGREGGKGLGRGREGVRLLTVGAEEGRVLAVLGGARMPRKLGGRDEHLEEVLVMMTGGLA